MAALAIPFQPLRTSLYDSKELFGNFEADDPRSYLTLMDFEIYRYFVAEGRGTPSNYLASMMQALHDNSITQTVSGLLAGKKCVAIMGGHKLGRSTPQFADIARLSSKLTQSGFLVASGGGPGAMEATHLGAAVSAESASYLDELVSLLSQTADLPADISHIVAENGVPDTSITDAAHAWFAPAMEIFSRISNPCESLAVPTWYYGHEPTTPFATKIAKYFQNSIREDGLLAIAHDGVIFAQGKAGTIQEIFQDSAQNYYRTAGKVSPMVFLDKTYWTSTFPVDAVLRALFKREDYARYVLFTDDIDEAHGFLVAGHN